jgi:hypothetical protein
MRLLPLLTDAVQTGCCCRGIDDSVGTRLAEQGMLQVGVSSPDGMVL